MQQVVGIAWTSKLSNQAMQQIIRLAELYENQFPDRALTNVAQIYEGVNPAFAYRWQTRFKEFGKYSGFKNSFYEKCAVAPPGISNQAIQGEMLLFSAEPFPGEAQQLGRLVVSRVGRGRDPYCLRWLPEKSIQEVFMGKGLQIPKPPTMAPLPTPADYRPDPILTRVQTYFRDVAGNMGIGRGSWWIVLLAYGVGAAVFALLLFVWFNRRRGD